MLPIGIPGCPITAQLSGNQCGFHATLLLLLLLVLLLVLSEAVLVLELVVPKAVRREIVGSCRRAILRSRGVPITSTGLRPEHEHEHGAGTGTGT